MISEYLAEDDRLLNGIRGIEGVSLLPFNEARLRVERISELNYLPEKDDVNSFTRSWHCACRALFSGS